MSDVSWLHGLSAAPCVVSIKPAHTQSYLEVVFLITKHGDTYSAFSTFERILNILFTTSDSIAQKSRKCSRNDRHSVKGYGAKLLPPVIHQIDCILSCHYTRKQDRKFEKNA